MLDFSPLFVKLINFLVGFELTTSGFAVDTANTLSLCHRRLCCQCCQHVVTVPQKTMLPVLPTRCHCATEDYAVSAANTLSLCHGRLCCQCCQHVVTVPPKTAHELL